MMKSIGFAAVAALFLASGAQAASFTYSATFNIGSKPGGSVITGSFDGDLNGNLITNLSKITAVLNGVAFRNSGSLYGSHYTSDGFVSGGAVASLDGSQNNFLFIDADFPNNGNYTNYYYNLVGFDINDYAFNGNDNNTYAYTSGTPLTTFTATQVATAAVPEPASWAMFIGGFGLVGGALRRRRTSVAFA